MMMMMVMMMVGIELVILMEGFCLAGLGGCGKENKAAQTSSGLFPWGGWRWKLHCDTDDDDDGDDGDYDNDDDDNDDGKL